MRPNFLKDWPILALLSVIALTTYIYLKNLITSKHIDTILNTLNGVVSDDIARYAASQAAFETANFSSDIFKQNNNMFGMKFAGQLNADGEKNGYADYKDYEHSIVDWAAWWLQKRNYLFPLPYQINNLFDYVQFLQNHSYFEADLNTYYNGCLVYYNKYFKA